MLKNNWIGIRPFQLHINKCVAAGLPIIVAVVGEDLSNVFLQGKKTLIDDIIYTYTRKPTRRELEVYLSLPRFSVSKFPNFQIEYWVISVES
jgi:hypothetical protein